MEILQLVPVDLSGLNQSIECSGGEMSPLRSWLCNDSALTRSSGFVPPPPSPACLGQNGSNFKYPSLQNNYMMAVSAFLSFRAQNILSNMGYAWMWRFSLSSKLLRPVTYNVFERLASEGKRYAFLSAVQERSECVSGAWKVARRLCEARPDCLGLLARWPPGMVVLTHFEVSHRSVWESAIFLELLNELQTLQRNYSSAFHATEQSIDAKTLWWWKDPLVHTLGVLLSLTVQDTLKLTNFPYQLVDVDKMIGAPQAHFLSGRHGHAYQFKSISGLDEKFRPQRFGWLGADVAASFALPRPEAWREFLCSRLSRPSTAAKCAAGKARGHELDQFIWLFGDTIIGTSSEFRYYCTTNAFVIVFISFLAYRRLEGVVVPNSVGMASIDASKQRPEERLVQVKYFWGSGAYGIPAEIFSVSGLDLVGDSSVHGAMNITEIGDHKANAMKYWPLSGVSILDLSGLPDAGLGLSGDDMLARACRVLVLGHVVVPNLKLASKFSSDAESLFGTEILDFSIVRSAFGIVSNPYSPPSMWSYIWRVIPPVRHGNIVSYEWFGLAHSSSSPGVTSAESLYMLGVVEYNTGGSTSAGYSQNQGSAAVRYNVIGRVSALNALGGQLDIEVIEDNAGGERSWKRLYGDDTVTAANCFPFHGVATEGTLDYDEDMLEWVFVGLIIFENAFQICRLSAATNAISGPPPIETCDWRCQVIPAVDKAWIGRSNIVSYAGRMHRELMQPKAKADRSRELVISYVPNVAGEPQELFSEINNQAYTPKFVSVRIDYDSKKSPAGLVNNFLKGWQ